MLHRVRKMKTPGALRPFGGVGGFDSTDETERLLKGVVAVVVLLTWPSVGLSNTVSLHDVGHGTTCELRRLERRASACSALEVALLAVRAAVVPRVPVCLEYGAHAKIGVAIFCAIP